MPRDQIVQVLLPQLIAHWMMCQAIRMLPSNRKSASSRSYSWNITIPKWKKMKAIKSGRMLTVPRLL